MTARPQYLTFAKLLILLICTVSVFGCAATPSLLEDGSSDEFAETWERERETGAEKDEEIVEEMGLYDDPDLQAYVADVGNRVLDESPIRSDSVSPKLREADFTFRVLDEDMVNAMALPGGYIYVTTGLLAYLNNEAQLATILGHEIVHVLAQHGQSSVNKGAIAMLGVAAAAVAVEAAAGYGEEALDIGGLAGEAMLASYSRENERESDIHGADYAAAAGYDIAEVAGFFRTLERMDNDPPLMLATHPDPGGRADWMERRGRYLDGAEVGTDRYLQHIEGLPTEDGEITIMTVEEAASIRDIFDGPGLFDPLTEHARINQVEMRETIPAGTKIKALEE